MKQVLFSNAQTTVFRTRCCTRRFDRNAYSSSLTDERASDYEIDHVLKQSQAILRQADKKILLIIASFLLGLLFLSSCISVAKDLAVYDDSGQIYYGLVPLFDGYFFYIRVFVI